MAQTIGQRIEHERKRQGLTLQQLALKCGLRFQNLSRLERGDRGGHVRSDTLIKVCRALGCSSDYLLGLDTDDDKQEPSA